MKLRFAAGTVDTLHGPVSSSWNQTEDMLRLDVTIPSGTEAEILLAKMGRKTVPRPVDTCQHYTGADDWKAGKVINNLSFDARERVSLLRGNRKR